MLVVRPVFLTHRIPSGSSELGCWGESTELAMVFAPAPLNRRRAHAPPPVRKIAGLRADPFRREAFRDGSYIALTRKQHVGSEATVGAGSEGHGAVVGAGDAVGDGEAEAGAAGG